MNAKISKTIWIATQYECRNVDCGGENNRRDHAFKMEDVKNKLDEVGGIYEPVHKKKRKLPIQNSNTTNNYGKQKNGEAETSKSCTVAILPGPQAAAALAIAVAQATGIALRDNESVIMKTTEDDSDHHQFLSETEVSGRLSLHVSRPNQ